MQAFRRCLISLCAFAGASSVGDAAPTTVTDAKVAEVTRSAILIDTHNDIPSKVINGYDIATANPSGNTDLARMKQGHLGAEFFSVFVDASYIKDNHAANRALQMIDAVRHGIIDAHPDDFAFATSADDIERAHRAHKIAALMGIEGGHAIEDSLSLLRDFYALGVRYMTLTHFNTNNWADSQGDIDDPAVQHHKGLTPFGKDVVREMNRLGMMVDVSHTADKTFFDALEVSTAPIIASHSSCRAVTNYTRNMTDEMIKALAEKGGVIQISLGCDFLSQRYYDAARPLEAQFRDRYRAAMQLTDKAVRTAALDQLRAKFSSQVPPATLQDVVAHIDHAVKVGGIDSVGIGTDYEGVACTPKELDGYDKFPALTRALLEKGYTADQIRKIYGGNLLRVMRAVERQARALRGSAPVAKAKDPVPQR